MFLQREEFMDYNRFDELAKTLADRSISRRETLRRLGAGLFGAVLASVGIASDAQGSVACKQDGQKCKASKECCSGNCDPSTKTCSASNCPAPTVSCNGTCVNVHTDITNCGTCGKVCHTGQSCVAG